MLKAGIFLKSTPALKDTVFEDTIIYVVQHNEKGALGFLINRPFNRMLNELEEFQHSISFPIYDGGPVDKEHLFILHQRPDLIEEGLLVDQSVYFGGRFNSVIKAINDGLLTTSNIKILIGYCGWDYGELEAEVEEGSWIIAKEPITTVFQ